MSSGKRVLASMACVTITAVALVFGAQGFLAQCFAAQSGKQTRPEEQQQAFQRMLKLAGDWQGTASMGGAEKHPAELSLRSTAGGNTLVETEFCGTEHEMTTVFYLDKGELVLTHYCHLANQPHMKAKVVSDKEIVFEFAGGSNIDPKADAHMHEARYQITDDDHFTSTWTLYAQGKETGKAVMEMTRKKPAAE